MSKNGLGEWRDGTEEKGKGGKGWIWKWLVGGAEVNCARCGRSMFLPKDWICIAVFSTRTRTYHRYV